MYNNDSSQRNENENESNLYGIKYILFISLNVEEKKLYMDSDKNITKEKKKNEIIIE